MQDRTWSPGTALGDNDASNRDPDETLVRHPKPTQFPRLRRALCRALDSGRHWTARNTVAACGTERELEALFGRDLPTADGQILRIQRTDAGDGILILRHAPLVGEPQEPQGTPLTHLAEGVDY